MKIEQKSRGVRAIFNVERMLFCSSFTSKKGYVFV